MIRFATCCAIAIVVSAASPARAGSLAVLSHGDDIIVVGPGLQYAEGIEYDGVGYHYQTLGILGLDVWRWGGGFVLFKDVADVDGELHDLTRGNLVIHSWRYQELNDQQLARVGRPRVPWKYYFPTGMVLILAMLELALVAPLRRAARLMLAIGGALFAFAGVLRAQGVDQAFAIPLLLGLYHTGAGWLALRRRPAGPRRERPPIIDADPFRMPPQPAPLAVRYPPAAPSEPAVVARRDGASDEEEPKHLR